jgi:heme a synthase
MATLLVWSWRRTAKGEWPRYSAVGAAVLLFNEAILGAMLVVFEHVGMDRSASRAAFLSLHFGNTPLFVAALTLTAKWLSNGPRRLERSANALERAVIAIGLFSIVASGMTGTLAALGDAIFPVANLKNALVQDFSSNSDVLLRLRTLHPVVAAVAVLHVLWMVRKLWKNREATLRHLSLPYGDIAGAGCSRRVERTPAGLGLAAAYSSAGGRNSLDFADACVSRSVVL